MVVANFTVSNWAMVSDAPLGGYIGQVPSGMPSGLDGMLILRGKHTEPAPPPRSRGPEKSPPAAAVIRLRRSSKLIRKLLVLRSTNWPTPAAVGQSISHPLLDFVLGPSSLSSSPSSLHICGQRPCLPQQQKHHQEPLAPPKWPILPTSSTCEPRPILVTSTSSYFR